MMIIHHERRLAQDFTKAMEMMIKRFKNLQKPNLPMIESHFGKSEGVRREKMNEILTT